jgi:hypothetical protein
MAIGISARGVVPAPVRVEHDLAGGLANAAARRSPFQSWERWMGLSSDRTSLLGVNRAENSERGVKPYSWLCECQVLKWCR